MALAALIAAASTGFLTIISPCILPVLPVILTGGLARRSRTYAPALVAGIVGTSTIAVILLSRVGGLLRYTPVATSVLLLVVGAVLIIPQVTDWIEHVLHRVLPTWKLSENSRISLLEGFLVGMLTGIAWLPCASPYVIGAGTVVGTQQAWLLYAVAYALGLALPLLAIIYSEGWVLNHLKKVAAIRIPFARITGAALILMALTTWLGLDQRAALWWGNQNLQTTAAVDREQPVLIPVGQKPLPSFDGFETTAALPIFTARITIIEVWAANCAQCAKTIPQLTQWNEEGIAIIGVHTPQYAFEKDPAVVAKAIDRLGITYPSVLDPQSILWAELESTAWPTIYVVDGSGSIRFIHAGSNDLADVQQVIDQLRAEASLLVSADNS